MDAMAGRMRGVEEEPQGLLYHADLLSEPEERSLLDELERTDFREVQMHGQVARRTVRHYGFDYGYESWDLVRADPVPEPIEPVRERCAARVGLPTDALAQTLVTRYPAGSTIGWHRDAMVFGGVVVGVSLASACVMRFQRRVGAERRVFELELAPRSAYVLAGAARMTWQHSIPAVPGLRYSITFRTLRRGAAGG